MTWLEALPGVVLVMAIVTVCVVGVYLAVTDLR